MQAVEGTLLLVEDDLTLAAALEHRLRRSRFKVLHAASGRAAFSVFDAGEPDLVILDLMLPDVPGEEVLDWVRENSNIPVIIISAKSAESDRIGTLNNGADDYITKPLSLSELEARIRAVLRRSWISTENDDNGNGSAHRSRSELSYGGITLGLSTREVWLDGERLEVSPIEFKLLRVLTERGGSAVSVEQIIRSVWSYDGYDRHIVESNIHRLRHKIEEDPRHPRRLVTVRGFGYKLVDLDGRA